MSIKDKIADDIKSAMREKRDFERDALRTLSAAIKQVEIDTREKLEDEAILAILQKEIKKRNDARAIYLNGGRLDLAQKEQDEAKLIARYLPAQLSDDELKNELLKIKNELNLNSIKELGALVKTAKERLKASADAKRISEVAKQILG